MIKTIFFDLDGTLLPMNNDRFIEAYFGKLADLMKKQKKQLNMKGIGMLCGSCHKPIVPVYCH